MGSNPTSDRKIGRVVKYNRCESGAQKTAVCLSRRVRIPHLPQNRFKIRIPGILAQLVEQMAQLVEQMAVNH